MCDPVTAGLVIMGVGAAASGVAAYKQTKHNNKNMKREQDAKNQAFKESMERQRGYADEAGKAFNTSIQDRGADSFQARLEDASQNRMNAFNAGRLEAPIDYAIGDAPKNVQLYQNKIFGEAEDKSVRDNTNLANLNAFQDTLFNKGIQRNDYARAFGNLSDKAQRDANLLNLDMNSAAFNSQKNLSPFWPILGGAGQMASTAGGAMAGAGATSDERLKQNIKKVGESPSGINIYEFEYIKNPKHRFIGVIAQELLETHPEAVIEENGYYSVNYDLIDVKFEQV